MFLKFQCKLRLANPERPPEEALAFYTFFLKVPEEDGVWPTGVYTEEDREFNRVAEKLSQNDDTADLLVMHDLEEVRVSLVAESELRP